MLPKRTLKLWFTYGTYCTLVPVSAEILRGVEFATYLAIDALQTIRNRPSTAGVDSGALLL